MAFFDLLGVLIDFVMQDFIVIQLSTDDIKAIIRAELKDFFATDVRLSELIGVEEEEIGGIELAEKITGLKRQTIYALVSQRKIPFSKPSKHLYFSRLELSKWIKDGRRKTAKEIAKMADGFSDVT